MPQIELETREVNAKNRSETGIPEQQKLSKHQFRGAPK